MLPYDASPKAISRRTSYLQVRLAFHRYPQVIRECCNTRRFGPPRHFTVASTCSWIGHLVSGLIAATKVGLFNLAFTVPHAKWLKHATTINSLDRSTKSTPSPRGAPTPCTHVISGSISLPFRGSFNLSLTVLVLYRS